MKRLLLLFVISMSMTTQAQHKRHTTPPLVYSVENTVTKAAKQDLLPARQLPVVHELPDALQGVKKFGKWAARRNAIGQLIQHYGIGKKPTVSMDAIHARMNGDTLVVDVTVVAFGDTLSRNRNATLCANDRY